MLHLILVAQYTMAQSIIYFGLADHKRYSLHLSLQERIVIPIRTVDAISN